jgi:spore germination protein KC
MTIFKDDKLLGYLDEKQSIFLSFAKGTIKNSLIGFEYKDGYINVECYDVDVSMDVDKSNNIKISIDGKATINEVTSNVDLEKNKVIEKINNKLNSEIKINTLKTINHIRKTYNSDVFGFLDLIYKNNNSSYKKIKSGWYIDGFKNASISIESNIFCSSSDCKKLGSFLSFLGFLISLNMFTDTIFSIIRY